VATTYQLTAIAGQALAVGVVQPASDLWWYWGTSTWTTPFNASNHLLAMVPIESGGSLVETIATANLGNAPLIGTDACVIIFNPNTSLIIDPRSLTWPLSGPLSYGWPSAGNV
jgi:hypothetical protein